MSEVRIYISYKSKLEKNNVITTLSNITKNWILKY